MEGLGIAGWLFLYVFGTLFFYSLLAIPAAVVLGCAGWAKKRKAFLQWAAGLGLASSIPYAVFGVLAVAN